jgi:hypothetical protein
MQRRHYGGDHLAFGDLVRTFISREVLPRYLEWESAGISPRELFTSAGSDLVVNGAKTFITNGVNADLVITVVRTSPDRHKGARRSGDRSGHCKTRVSCWPK